MYNRFGSLTLENCGSVIDEMFYQSRYCKDYGNRGPNNQELAVVGSVAALHNKNCISFVDLTSFISKLNEHVRNKKER